MLEEDFSLVVALGQLAAEIAFLLMGGHIIDEALLGLEVEGHGIALVFGVAHLEYRLVAYAALLERVGGTHGVYQTAVHAQGDAVAGQVHVLVLHIGLAVDIGTLGFGVVDQRVVALVAYRCVDTVLLGSVDRVEAYRVVDGFVVVIYGQLERVHLGGINGGKGGGDVFLNGVFQGDGVVFHLPVSLLTRGCGGLGHHKDDGKQEDYYKRFSLH